jgi:hypothetical protein
MKVQARTSIVIGIVLSSIYYGCVVVGDRTVFDPKAIIPVSDQTERAFDPNQATPKRIEVEAEAGSCRVSFLATPNGTVIKNSIKLLQGDPTECRVTEDNTPITVNGKTVKFMGPTQITLEGSSCYCWYNTARQLTCVGAC